MIQKPRNFSSDVLVLPHSLIVSASFVLSASGSLDHVYGKREAALQILELLQYKALVIKCDAIFGF